MSKPLRVLMTIQSMEQPAGGSLYVRDLAMELFRQGHAPLVYCRRLGEVSQELLGFGIPVVDSLGTLTQPDIIHGNSPIETVASMLYFPTTPAVFVCHGWRSPDALPPKLPRIIRYLAVSEHARDSLRYFYGLAEDRIEMHMNSVDLQRFPRRGRLPDAPRRALILSNLIGEGNHLDTIREVCVANGVSLDVIGLAMGTARLDPETILGEYDLVFAKGRSALEALARGCAVILCDTYLGELITSENYDTLRRRNFGIRAFHSPVTRELISAQFKRYDPSDAAAVSDRVRRDEGLVAATLALVEVYRSSIREFRESPVNEWHSERLAVAHFLDAIAPTSNTFFLAEQLRALERRTRRAEARLHHISESLGMKPLSPSELSQISVRLVKDPINLDVDAVSEAVVEIGNGCASLLSSMGAYPMHLSYHWLAEDGTVVCFEGLRSELYPPLAPGHKAEYRVRIQAPGDGDRLTLRITVVQEFVAWLDDLGVSCDVPCSVLGALITNRTRAIAVAESGSSDHENTRRTGFHP